MMEIIFDGTPLFNHKTGVGYYTENLIKSLSEYTDINIRLYFNGIKPSRPIDTKVGKVHKLLFPYDALREKRINEKFYNLLNVEFLTGSFDIFHGVNFHSWPTKKAKKVITFHDLAFYKYPDLMPRSIVQHHMRWALASLRVCDHIITVSNSVKNELIQEFQIEPQKITVTPLAANRLFTHRPDERALLKVKKKYSLNQPFILYVGTIEFRKNVIRMVEAFYIARTQFGLPHRLVIVGGQGYGAEQFHRKLHELKIADVVSVLGYVDEIDLPYIYNLAEIFLYVSLYEGFGLPILEAMQSGLPVITSNKSSMPEVAGDAAMVVNPENVSEIAETLSELIASKNKRYELSQRGIERSKQFSWEKTAAMTKKVYEYVN